MVNVGAFCIDVNEVTNGDYVAFLADAGAPSQPPECAWNDKLVPSQAWPAPPSAIFAPVAWVDWCDAWAYCAWAGKRLCGKIGGGSIGLADYVLVTSSAWFNACTHGGDRGYPYGTTYEAQRCNGADYRPDAGALVPVGTATGCVGGFPGIHDMSGNVEEWEDACGGASGASDMCRNRGGNFLSTPNGLACASDSQNARSFASGHTGFRCCSP
jgi:formylglycine-generating enzyme required for sulfatase activity